MDCLETRCALTLMMSPGTSVLLDTAFHLR